MSSEYILNGATTSPVTPFNRLYSSTSAFPRQTKNKKKRNSICTYESKQTVTIERFHTNDPVINICQQLYVPKTIQGVKIRLEDLKHYNQQLIFL